MAPPKKKAAAKGDDETKSVLQSCADRLGSAAITDFNGVPAVLIPKVVVEDIVAKLKELSK